MANSDFPNLRISPALALPDKIEQGLKRSILKQKKGFQAEYENVVRKDPDL
jgi:hypothetical protein